MTSRENTRLYQLKVYLRYANTEKNESEQDLVASATVDMVCVFVCSCFFSFSRGKYNI